MQTSTVLSETLVFFREARRLSRDRLLPARSTLARWAREGLLSAGSDRRVTLEWAYRGGRNRVTSREAILRFYKRVNGEEA